jgi:dienelactone hydrolase
MSSNASPIFAGANRLLDDGEVADVVLFHSVYGRRRAVLDAADRLRVAGHTVVAPDLYAGQVAAIVDEGFALCDQIGWPVFLGRARHALAGMPAETVLAGPSMGQRSPLRC